MILTMLSWEINNHSQSSQLNILPMDSFSKKVKSNKKVKTELDVKKNENDNQK
ncbi:hypothetical protein [Leptospira sp. GIMC2001]|uniref:hypothetical protein n=1 Tax=Leptospira sp. GIMC2001 TaxID=1513297 RepID=UPI0023494B4A|nr:hypothetical protein [Leptospira sp. GIMC2001]WCL48687.1 hypothetical protein O4O04_15450 [Leptospira sp. GIMC2001]